MMPPTPPGRVPLKDASRLTGYSVVHLLREVKAGRLPTWQRKPGVGNPHFVKLSDLSGWFGRPLLDDDAEAEARRQEASCAS